MPLQCSFLLQDSREIHGEINCNKGAGWHGADAEFASMHAVSIGELWRKARKTSRLLGRARWRRGLFHGVAATVEHAPLMTMIHPRTVIDVGANKGQFTLFALEAWPGCRVIEYESLPGPAAVFRKLFADTLRVASALLPQIKHVYLESSVEELYEGQAPEDEITLLMRNADFTKSWKQPAQYGEGRGVQEDCLVSRL